MILLSITLFGLLLRLLQLDTLPGEIWGDVIEHYKLVQSILHGDFFFNYRFGGDGPLFSYVNSFLSFFFGLSFYSLKLSTVIAGTLLVFFSFYLTQEYFKNKKISYITSFLMAISFWSLSFSRQAKPHIFVPLFITLTFLFALKKKKILSGLFLGLGMYTQAGFWGTILLFLPQFKIISTAIIIMLPLLYTSFQNIPFYLNGNSFFGEKLGLGSHLPITTIALRLLTNLYKNTLSFFTTGDSAFRHNISGEPHIDFISRIFFLIGFSLIIKDAIQGNKKLLVYFILPFFVIQIPSIVDINNPLSIPNMGRMIGIIPFVYMSVSYGLYKSSLFLKKLFSTHIRFRIDYVFIVVILLLIFWINTYNYFFIYPLGLPNRNIPFGKIITKQINSYSAKTKTVVIGSGWGEWGQPEVEGIQIMIKNPTEYSHLQQLSELKNLVCSSSMSQKSFVVFMNPTTYRSSMHEYLPCPCSIKEYFLNSNEVQVARVVEGTCNLTSF